MVKHDDDEITDALREAIREGIETAMADLTERIGAMKSAGVRPEGIAMALMRLAFRERLKFLQERHGECCPHLSLVTEKDEYHMVSALLETLDVNVQMNGKARQERADAKERVRKAGLN